LYITTSTLGLSETELAKQPLAGALLAVEPGVRGLPEVPFAG
jgi:sugar lactone lactonase YvrE